LLFANLVTHFLQKILSRPFGHCRKLSPAFAILHDPPPATVLPLKTGGILARAMNEIQTNNNRGAGVSPASRRLSAHLHGSNADCLKSSGHMNDTQTQQRFVHLRAEGWSFARIAAEINGSKPTLINWSRKFATLDSRHSALEALFTPIRSRIGKLTVNKR